MNNHLELPWSMKDTIENMKDLKQMLSERIKKANYDGKGETDAEEIKFDFDRAISALEKQIAKKPSEQSYNQSFMDEGIDDGVEYLCPNCKSIVGAYSNGLEDWLGQQKHCEDCGQKIDWSEVENE